MPVAELLIGFWWYCDVCGAENFVKSMTPEDPDEVRDMHDDAGTSQENGMWLYIPDVVECSECKTEHEAKDGSVEELE